jgi:pseudaminic acid synthase
VAELGDIQFALETLRKNSDKDQIIILKCTSSYPASLEEANLLTMRDMRNKFDTLVGLSDHTTSPNVPAYAVALGACMVEKHFALEKKGPDAKFSLTPHEFSIMAKNIRECESAMGEISYDLTERIREHRTFMRSIFASDNIKSGERFTDKNIRVIRPGTGMHPKYYDDIIGKQAVRDIKMGEPLKTKLVKK